MEFYAKINTDISNSNSNSNLAINQIVKLLSCELNDNFVQNIKVEVMDDNMEIYDISSIYIDSNIRNSDISEFEEKLRKNKLKIASDI